MYIYVWVVIVRLNVKIIFWLIYVMCFINNIEKFVNNIYILGYWKIYEFDDDIE